MNGNKGPDILGVCEVENKIIILYFFIAFKNTIDKEGSRNHHCNN
jgi:hypothetical protein